MLVIPITFNLDKQQSAYPLTEIIASHDVQSIKFELSFNGIDLTGKTVKVLSKYESSGSQTLIDCLIEDGKAILIPDTSLISGDGYVHNYVYVYEGASSLDVQEFLYETKLSEIDRSSVVIKKVYDKSYNNLLIDFEQSLNEYKLTMPELSAEIDAVLNQFVMESQAKLNQYDGRQLAYEQAESGRASSESTRRTNETTRISNENERRSAEVIRLASEVDRVNAENVRSEFYEGFESGLGEKANKTQEAWQTLTLLNGITGTVKIMKDSFGFVHLEGELFKDVWTSGLLIASIPIEYRPDSTKHFLSPANYASTATRSLLMTPSGEVLNYGTVGQRGYINIVYRAGV